MGIFEDDLSVPFLTFLRVSFFYLATYIWKNVRAIGIMDFIHPCAFTFVLVDACKERAAVVGGDTVRNSGFWQQAAISRK